MGCRRNDIIGRPYAKLQIGNTRQQYLCFVETIIAHEIECRQARNNSIPSNITRMKTYYLI